MRKPVDHKKARSNLRKKIQSLYRDDLAWMEQYTVVLVCPPLNVIARHLEDCFERTHAHTPNCILHEWSGLFEQVNPSSDVINIFSKKKKKKSRIVEEKSIGDLVEDFKSTQLRKSWRLSWKTFFFFIFYHHREIYYLRVTHFRAVKNIVCTDFAFPRDKLLCIRRGREEENLNHFSCKILTERAGFYQDWWIFKGVALTKLNVQYWWVYGGTRSLQIRFVPFFFAMFGITKITDAMD